MKPSEVSKAIEKRMRRQIRKTLPIERSVPDLGPVIDDFFDRIHPLSKEPYLEVVTAYRPAESLQELADEGIIHEETAKIFACYFAGSVAGNPASIRLHAHQASAVREVCKNGKNLVVCTGTGSGKTEAFLIPLIDHLVRENARGTLGPGVRAMILYPMNALVNDQIRRLRSILKWATFIRFGKYTGETETESSFGRDKLEAASKGFDEIADQIHASHAGLGYDDEAILSNEVTTRRAWHASPAHILVTNYSMLERLLLNPQTSVLFGAHWKHIVLDEAHCYSGALGTEISWLVRRVKQRVESIGKTPKGQIRFLATSATLISDPNLSPTEKKDRIRKRFASRLFPAAADTFAVQFGVIAEHEPLVATSDHGRSAQTYIDLIEARFGESTLFEDSKAYLGRKTGQNRLIAGLEAVLENAPSASLGDLLFVAADVEATFGSDSPLTRSSKLLDANSSNVTALLEILTQSIGRWNDKNAWRKWLHDTSDSSPSSIRNDTYRPRGTNENRQQTIGNRLHLLAEWQLPLNDWSCHALEWLLQIASCLAAEASSEFEPSMLQVSISEMTQSALRQALERIREIAADDIIIATKLNESWAELTNSQKLGSFQETLAGFLDGDPHLARFRGVIDKIHHADDAESATAGSLASKVFGSDGARDSALDSLISLGTLAKQAGKRTPLLDVRYHQMVRGIESPGLKLSLGNHGVAVELLEELADDALSLGLCRVCGQPFALGYSENEAFDAGNSHMRLSPAGEARRHWLHAFAWQRGELPADMDEFATPVLDNLWLNTKNGEARRNQNSPNGSDWVPIIAHAAANSTDFKRFIPECPTCGERQRPQQGSRYGIITPYETMGDSVRLAAMEQLVLMSGASEDPSVRRHPGEGRKLLVFSDSRSGSAGMALGFQDYFAETTMGQLVKKAAEAACLPANLTDEEILHENGVPEAQWELYKSAPPFMAQQRNQWSLNFTQEPTLQRVSDQLEKMLREKNLAGLLSVAKLDDSGNATGDLDASAAAQWHLINATLRKGRYALRSKQAIRLDSLAFHEVASDYLNDLGLPNDAGGKEIFSMVLKEILSWLADRTEVALPLGFPPDPIQRYKKMVSEDGRNESIRWRSQSANATMNRFLRCVIAEETDFWLAGLRFNIQEVEGNLARQLARRLSETPDPEFRSIIEKIVSAKTAENAAGLPPNIIQDAKPSDIAKVAKKARSYFCNMAGSWLDILWPIFTLSENRTPILVDNGVGEYRLNPEALLIHPGMDSYEENADGVHTWAEEDAYLAHREIIPLRIEEHTAQLAKSRGSDYQRAFADGNINILSCSTTFEMGVDLGDLSCVFLNGMPPGVANYRQRAGRAGRRPGSPSYVLTFLGRRDHDRYFWERPGELLYAPLEEPKIYMDNPMYRARHLRAEAFHDFLSWLVRNNRNKTVGQTYVFENGQTIEQASEITRSWSYVGDLFAGLKSGKKIPEGDTYSVKARFRPMVDELDDWHEERSKCLQLYLENIENIGVGNLSYTVASDLIWQLRKHTPGDIGYAPYDMSDDQHFWEIRLLGGPNSPVAKNGKLTEAKLDDQKPDIRRLPVQAQVKYYLPDEVTALINGFQRHLLGEQTITWLSRCRVLPKYGFPVDVISLLPNRDDNYGKNVKLERDLKVGLFEYAPGREVIADKRRYRSKGVLVWENGRFNENAGVIAQERMICPECHEPDWSANSQQDATCRYCGSAVRLVGVNLCFPDAFSAQRSSASYGRKSEPGASIHVHTRAFRPTGVSLPQSGLITKESESGTITYINQGPSHRGFMQDDQRFALCHEVRTDIAGWMLSPSLFRQGGLLIRWENQWVTGRKRLESAMRSAMYAILRAIATEKQIEEREVQGILQPGNGQNGQLGFVLFDDSTGGGGAVLDLILTGNDSEDSEKAAGIRKILETAVKLCEDCTCGNIPPEQIAAMPVSKDEKMTLNQTNLGDFRLATSCYKCLRNHRNQSTHPLLDRHDAATLIREILIGENSLPTQGTTRLHLNQGAGISDRFTFVDDSRNQRHLIRSTSPLSNSQWALVRLPEGFAYGTWMIMDRERDGVPQKRLRLSNGSGLAVPLHLSVGDFEALDVWIVE